MFGKSLALLFIILSSPFCLPATAHACPKLSTAEASQEMNKLAADICYHNQLYYEKAQPEINDAEYDRRFAQLVELEECFPGLVAADSPTKTIGGVESAGVRKVQHEQPMLSLSSATGPEAVAILIKRVAAFEDVQLLVQPKVDGVPVELTYASGKLVSAATRGNGSFGTALTERVREIQGVPLELSGRFPERVVMRGEVYADLTLLQQYRANTAAEKYAGPRHLVAGVLVSQKADPAAVAVLRLFPFELVSCSGDYNLSSDCDSLKLLAEWGFPDTLSRTRTAKSFADVQSLYYDYLANRDKQPYAMDGIVVKVDDLSLRSRLGEGERAPFWAAAWKFPPDSAVTRVRKIDWTVGRSGRRTPVAEVELVRLGDVLVRKVSLHSAAELDRLHIANGDQVLIGLVGDVIPQVLEVVVHAAQVSNSSLLPAKSSQVALDVCLKDSPACREQFLAKAVYFTSKSGLAIEGLGRKRLQKLIEAGLVNDLPSLFLLKTVDVAAVTGFGMETAQRLNESIRVAGQSDSFRIVAALGIAGVGPKSVLRLSRHFTSLNALLAARPGNMAALAVAEVRAAKTIQSFFVSPGGAELLHKFREQLVL